MAFQITEMFAEMISSGAFDFLSTLFIIAFIIWELPRSIKLMDEEYTTDVYPENGRVVDFFLFAVGLGAIAFLYMWGALDKAIEFLKIPFYMLIFIPAIIVIPLMIIMGYFKRFFDRMDAGKSLTVFLVNSFLDLAHTLFFISLSMVVIPIIGLLIFGGN